MNNNALIVGAGPSGIMTACILAAIHPQAQITVLDNRKETSFVH